jgi:branched-subunit amino acid ABC-type transport system permease component
MAAASATALWASFTFFVILVVVLVVRPQGLYGIRVRERI